MGYYLTYHAAERAKQMGLTAQQIEDLIMFPQVGTQCPSRKDPNHLIWLLRRDGVTAFADFHDDGEWYVITFVPATEEKWREQYPAARDGREFRADEWNRKAPRR
jgi:hypothetical protein